MRAAGGYQFYTDASAIGGAELPASSTAWSALSDSTMKRNIRLVDTREMLDKVNRLPIKRWSLKTQDPSIEHIGPMAQDFWALFHVGENELRISTIDPPAIALAAIQGLHEIVKENEERMGHQQDLIDSLMKQNKQLENRLLALESSLSQEIPLEDEGGLALVD